MNKQSITKGMSSTASSAGRVGKNFANQGWSALPVWGKGIIFVVVGFGVYKLIKSIGRAVSRTKLNENTRDSKQEVEGWFKSFQEDSRKEAPTMTNTMMKSLANKIWTAMDGYGTRDYDLKQAFKKIKNNADFSGVQSAYGTKTLQPGHGVGWFVSSFRGTMVQCVQDDASSSTIDDINKTLKSNGVKYSI